MKKVRDRLYIGNIKDAANVLTATHPPVTHMLSLITPNIDPLEYKPVSDSPSQEEANELLATANGGFDDVELERLIVPIRDIESQNLLDHLDECLEFIERGKGSGTILVHCMAGVSRSAAVITAYLMRSEHLSVDDALSSLQQVSQKVYPNYGFMQQLLLFGEMGNIVDRTNLAFKKFHLENLGEAFGRGEKMESSRYAADPGVTTTNSQEDSETGVSATFSPSAAAEYSCKKCKRVVAYQENVIPHYPSSRENSFRWRRRGGGRWGGEDDEPSCTSVFVEPMRWMTPVQDGAVEGKLHCLSCESRLGNFSWAGVQCSCGTRITPAFQLHKCSIDSSRTIKADPSEEKTHPYSYHTDFSTPNTSRLCGHLLV